MNFGSNSDKVQTLAPGMCRLKFQQNSDFISNKSGHKRKNYTSKRDGKEHLESTATEVQAYARAPIGQ